MTHDEYEKKRVALLTHYIHVAMSVGADEAKAVSLAKQLAGALDRLVLEIDPFEAKPAGARATGGKADRR